MSGTVSRGGLRGALAAGEEPRGRRRPGRHRCCGGAAGGPGAPRRGRSGDPGAGRSKSRTRRGGAASREFPPSSSPEKRSSVASPMRSWPRPPSGPACAAADRRRSLGRHEGQGTGKKPPRRLGLAFDRSRGGFSKPPSWKAFSRLHQLSRPSPVARGDFMKPHLRSLFSPRGLVATLALTGALVVAPGAARAHIKMSLPADWITTNSLGDPQKDHPVRRRSDDAVDLHGHQRRHHPPRRRQGDVQLDGDRPPRRPLSNLSGDQLARRAEGSTVTKMNSDGTAAEVEISTAYPVLADNLFPHTAASVSANKAYTYTVTIPNTPCTKCTLQLLQFMANHPLDPSYFYHQCADVMILGAGGGQPAAAAAARVGRPAAAAASVATLANPVEPAERPPAPAASRPAPAARRPGPAARRTGTGGATTGDRRRDDRHGRRDDRHGRRDDRHGRRDQRDRRSGWRPAAAAARWGAGATGRPAPAASAPAVVPKATGRAAAAPVSWAPRTPT